MPKYLTADEVAERLRLTPWQVTRLCRTGKIAATRPGRAWLITEDAVAELLDRHSNADLVAAAQTDGDPEPEAQA